MNPEPVIHALLLSAFSAAPISGRVFVDKPESNSALPSAAYFTVSAFPRPNLAYQNGPQRASCRFQVSCHAMDPGECGELQEALRAEIDFAHQRTVDGHLIVSCRRVISHRTEKVPDTGVWEKSADYVMLYYE